MSQGAELDPVVDDRVTQLLPNQVSVKNLRRSLCKLYRDVRIFSHRNSEVRKCSIIK